MDFFLRKKTAIVIRQLGGIGDVLTLSCIYRGIKEKYPDLHVINITTQIYLCGSLIDLAKHNHFIDDIVEISPYDAATDITKSWWRQYEKSERLEDEIIIKKSEYAIDLNVACIQKENDEINLFGKVQTPRYKIWCDAADIIPSSYAPIYNITKKEQEEADDYIEENLSFGNKPIVGIGLSSADIKRGFSKDKLHQVAIKLQNMGCTVVTVDPTYKFDDVPYLIGKKVKELMPIIKRMSAFVSVDSGLLHMAGVAGTPVIGLFGPTDYKMRMAYYKGSAIDSSKFMPCAPCWYNHPCMQSPNPQDHLKCMKMINEDVIVNETMKWVRS